jgi:glycine cleavage system H lipoate-binding protein
MLALLASRISLRRRLATLFSSIFLLLVRSVLCACSQHAGTKVVKGKAFCAIESVKAASDIYAPISGSLFAR